MESKEIRVYGTLVNHTTIPADGDRARVDSGHNDSIAYAYQLYDQRFGASPSVQNYQDNINKRVKGITYDPSTGKTTINGDLYVAGDLTVTGDISGISLGDLDDVNTAGAQDCDTLVYDAASGKWKPSSVNLASLLSRIAALESLWTDNGTTLTAKSGRSVTGAGFYDSTIS